MATGGSAHAASKLVQRLGGEVIGYSFLLELSYLNGRDLLEKIAPVKSLIIIERK